MPTLFPRASERASEVVSLALTRREVHTLAVLLDLLNQHLESGIESCLIHGCEDPAPEFAHVVRRDRRLRRRSEDLLIRLQEAL